MRSTLFMIVLASLPACSVFGADADLATAARDVFRSHCYKCHNGPGSTSGYDFDVLSPASMKKEGVLEPGDPDTSDFYEAVSSQPPRMPPRVEREQNPVTAEEISTLKAWIEADAPEVQEQAQPKQNVSLVTLLQAVRDYLREQDSRDRPYLRFFTLHHFYNNPKTTAADLAVYQAALSKALNSLSWSPQIVVPKLIDEADNKLFGTVLVIDTRDLVGIDGRSWAELRHWNRLVQSYPYGVAYTNPADDRAELYAEIAELLHDGGPLTTTVLPLLRADWFIATATRPPLYHDLLGLPQDAHELEEHLGVNIRAALQKPTPEVIARAGFPKSGVSGQNRLLERNRARHGAYWKSYDFLPTTRNASLVRFPLGPARLVAPHDRHAAVAFEHDGGEIIFHLPNGLQAYMLVDGKDQRIDEGPINVVSDSLKTSGTPAIVNGLSCMACHKQGMIDFVDTIRDGNALSGRLADDVANLYPAAATMQKLVDRDRQRYVNAQNLAIEPFLKPSGKSLKETPDPVAEVASQYRLVYLDQETMARELDFASAADLAKEAGSETLRSLGLQAVFSQGARISRNEWELTAGRSLMQEFAGELGLSPILPIR